MQSEEFVKQKGDVPLEKRERKERPALPQVYVNSRY
jgi:hypothetical protein